MNKSFKYINYVVYSLVLIYAIYSFDFTKGTLKEFIDANVKEIFFISCFIIWLLANFIMKKLSVAVQETKFIDTLNNDLESERNQLFIQIRDTKVHFLDSNLLKSISQAVQSQDWWDFSYLVKNEDMVPEINKSFKGQNEAASLTVFKNYPLKENYIFVGTIQNSVGSDFPDTVTPNPRNYQLEFDRLYVYRKKRRFLGFGGKYSFKLIEENENIAAIYEKTMNKLRKQLVAGNHLHAHWSKDGTPSLPDNCKDFNAFLQKVGEL